MEKPKFVISAAIDQIQSGISLQMQGIGRR